MFFGLPTTEIAFFRLKKASEIVFANITTPHQNTISAILGNARMPRIYWKSL
jgi:hypothetical protein